MPGKPHSATCEADGYDRFGDPCPGHACQRIRETDARKNKMAAEQSHHPFAEQDRCVQSSDGCYAHDGQHRKCMTHDQCIAYCNLKGGFA